MAEARGEEGRIRPPTTIITAFAERRLGTDSMLLKGGPKESSTEAMKI